ncbi:amidohydrolase family protein [Microvirga massiliensis]|uniref:amidohydrolase family protein n=1 Tax=Microvirga massiliensis TaxID=1033741 RepID=UPI00062B7D3E|nr:amidohydrolase family protein [Microvirga massiliensis]
MSSIDPAQRPRLKVPADACDTHMHLYGSRYPLAPTALGAPPDAGVEDYRKVQQRLGLQRIVVVQPSAYGTDNRCTLDGIAALGLDQARGIAVIDESVDAAELEALTRGGIRGVRFHMLPGGALPWESLDAIAGKVQDIGWHIQLQLDGRTLPDREHQIRSWPGRIVIDHVGKFLEPVGPDHPAFRCLKNLIETGRVWIKLSAPYEVSKSGAPGYDDVGRLAKELVRLAPERMLWASNWPHPSVKDKPSDAALLDLLLDWAPDDATRHRILVENPEELYGF